MKAAPQKRRSKPRYPTKLEVQQDPELLRRHLPATWAAHPELATAAALLLTLTLPGCDSNTANEKKATAVAPIFEHGEGRGSIGCVAVAPPVFLSEEEAWTVIDEELAKAKISLPDRLVPLQGVMVSQRTTSYEKQGDTWIAKSSDIPNTASQFKADRGGLQNKVALEFVSRERFEQEGGSQSDSTAQSFNFKDVAKSLAKQANNSARTPLYFGVLYDPLIHFGPDSTDLSINLPSSNPANDRSDWRPQYEQRKARARAESKRLLRLQVQDFIHWLQAQGAI